MEELIKNELRKIIGEQYDGSFFEPITGVYKWKRKYIKY